MQHSLVLCTLKYSNVIFGLPLESIPSYLNMYLNDYINDLALDYAETLFQLLFVKKK